MNQLQNSFVVIRTNFHIVCLGYCCCFSIFFVHVAINLKGRFYLTTLNIYPICTHLFIILSATVVKAQPLYFLWKLSSFFFGCRVGSLFMTFCFDCVYVVYLVPSYSVVYVIAMQKARSLSHNIKYHHQILLFGQFVIFFFFCSVFLNLLSLFWQFMEPHQKFTSNSHFLCCFSFIHLNEWNEKNLPDTQKNVFFFNDKHIFFVAVVWFLCVE